MFKSPALQPVHLSETLTDRPALIMFLHEGHDQYPLVFFSCLCAEQFIRPLGCTITSTYLHSVASLPFQNNVPKPMTSEECM
jgi:hypothetical protein